MTFRITQTTVLTFEFEAPNEAVALDAIANNDVVPTDCLSCTYKDTDTGKDIEEE